MSGGPILVNAEAVQGDLGARGVVDRPAVLGHEVQGVEHQAHCEACGKHHGSAGREAQCMRLEIRRLREIVSRTLPL